MPGGRGRRRAAAAGAEGSKEAGYTYAAAQKMPYAPFACALLAKPMRRRLL